MDELSRAADPKAVAWRRYRWVLLAAACAAGLGALLVLRSPEAQSRWILERRGAWLVFIEKSAPPEARAVFSAALPAAASAAWKAAGLDLAAPVDERLFVFASWGGYGALSADDPIVKRAFAGLPSGEIRLVSVLAREFRLDEPVANCFATPDGAYLFIDLQPGETGTAIVHGLSHVLARRRAPPGLLPPAGGAGTGSWNPREARAFRFVEETVALYLGDIGASGADAGRAGAAEAYESWARARYAEGGALLRDERLTFALGSDPRTPAYFTGAAALARGIVAGQGVAAMALIARRVLSGDYPDMDSLFGGRGALTALLRRHLGSSELPD